MRKIIVLSFISLDGVLQAPGGPKEDRSGGFTYGGWVAPYADEVSGNAIKNQMEPADLLLGRKTFEIWEDYWPAHAHIWPGINNVTKYVFSKTRKKTNWNNTIFFKNVSDIKKLKKSKGADIKVWGSGELFPLLLRNNLVDELWLKIYPVILGKGKKLFGTGTSAAAFKLTESFSTPSGVIFANYRRAGKVKTGAIGA